MKINLRQKISAMNIINDNLCKNDSKLRENLPKAKLHEN